MYLLCFIKGIYLPNSIRAVMSYREVFFSTGAANPVIPLKCKVVNNVPKFIRIGVNVTSAGQERVLKKEDA